MSSALSNVATLSLPLFPRVAFSDAVEAVPLPCWIAEQSTGRVLQVNGLALQIFEVTRSEFLAEPPAEGHSRASMRLEAGQLRGLTLQDGFELRMLDAARIGEALRASRERERRYRELVDGSADALFETDVEGRFTFVNAAMIRMLGYPPGELVGKHCTRVIHPDWVDTAMLYYRRQAEQQSGTSSYLEFPVLRRDGVAVWIGQNVQLITDGDRFAGFRAVARDVTERRIAEQRFQVFMDHSPAVAFVKDANSRYVYANQLMNSLFAEPAQTVIGRSDAEILSAELASRIHENDQRVLEESVAIQVLEAYPTRDGETRHWLSCKFPITAPDGTNYLGGMAVDLTERIALESELAAARDAALASTRMKSEFLANMSHEIRTPMNGVLGLLGLLLDSRLDADQRELAETARSSAESLLTIINDILDFSKIEAGKLEFESEDFEVREACASTIDLLANAANEKGLEIAYVIDPEIPALVRGDKGRLRQVLLNLIGNAVKFTTDGGVLVQADVKRRAPDSVTLEFRISDTGLGLDEATQRRLFQPFTQSDASTTRRFGGTGLGLAISRQLVELMGGTIGVESAPECGATFFFTVTLACTDQRPPVLTREFDAPKVLVVDDSMTTRQMIALQLTAWHVHNDLADSVATGLSMLRQAKLEGVPYDLVISDLHLPQMNGLMFASLVKSSDQFGTPRFVLHTADANPLDEEAMANAGVAQWLRKPAKQEHLFSAVFGQPGSPSPSPVRSEPRLARRVASHRILVADDNAVNQKVATRQLERLGYDADVAASGAEVVAALERIAYDLVLMDCQMPIMDGYEATAAIRAMEADGRRRTPIIAMTASVSESDRERCLRAGMDDFLPKPTKSQDLLAALEKWLPADAVRGSG
jgi:two-component system sensor histidine kinase/response regulator